MNVAAQSTSIPEIFSFQTLSIRIIELAGQLWFVAKDVMLALEYAISSNPSKMTEHIPEEWKGVKPIHTLGGEQSVLMLSEPGLYFFLGRSDKPKALPFQKWLAGEVLPSIRKTGSYQTKEPLCDVVYRQEAEKAAMGYFDACRKMVEATGQKPPQFPEINTMVVSGLLANLLRDNRWLLTFDPVGRMNISLVKNDAWISPLAEFAEMIADPAGPMIANSALANIAKACNDKLARRLQ